MWHEAIGRRSWSRSLRLYTGILQCYDEITFVIGRASLALNLFSARFASALHVVTRSERYVINLSVSIPFPQT